MTNSTSRPHFTRTLRITAAAAFTSLILAAPALAAPEHASCADEVHTVIVPYAQDGLGHDLAAPLAQSGQMPTVIEQNQATYCEPRP